MLINWLGWRGKTGQGREEEGSVRLIGEWHLWDSSSLLLLPRGPEAAASGTRGRGKVRSCILKLELELKSYSQSVTSTFILRRSSWETVVAVKTLKIA